LEGDGRHHHAAADFSRHPFGDIGGADREIDADPEAHEQLPEDQHGSAAGKAAHRPAGNDDGHVEQHQRTAAEPVGHGTSDRSAGHCAEDQRCRQQALDMRSHRKPSDDQRHRDAEREHGGAVDQGPAGCQKPKFIIDALHRRTVDDRGEIVLRGHRASEPV